MSKNKNKPIIIEEPNFNKAKFRSTSNLDFIYADLSVPNNLKQWANNKKYLIKTFGCQGNVRDTEYLKGYFNILNMSETDDFSNADIILFNTCAIRENAENKLFAELGNLRKYYEKNKNLIIGVCGCVMQEENPYSLLRQSFPFVKLVFGTFNINHIFNLLSKVIENNTRVIEVFSKQGEIIENMPTVRNDKYKAFVNIMYGCDKFCSYCIVPFTRGQQRSRKLTDILKEVNQLIENGYKEVTLVGQNVNSYGLDLTQSDKTSFYELLEQVAQTNIERIRFTTSHPFDFNEKVFEIMAKYKNIMPALHLPLQSGSDSVLKTMNRKYDVKRYKQLVALLRKHIPDVCLTTDIIVGFPTETLEDFNKTIELCKEIRFDAAYTFIFSPREGTVAAKMTNITPKDEISRRFLILKDTIDKITEEKGREYVNKTVNVLFDSISKKNENMISGYDEHNKLIHVKYQDNLIGTIRKVKIKESHTFSFIGEVLDE